MEYDVIRSPRRKRIAFRINRYGKLEVLAPPYVSLSRLDDLVSGSYDLIEKMKTRASALPEPVYRKFTEGEMFPFFDRLYPLHFSRRISHFDENGFVVPQGDREDVRQAMERLYRKLAFPVFLEKSSTAAETAGLEFAAVSISNAKSRWGSCSSRKELRFCWKLLLLPERLADYIVRHELAHLKYMDHSRNFWDFVEKLCPNYRECRKILNSLPDPWG